MIEVASHRDVRVQGQLRDWLAHRSQRAGGVGDTGTCGEGGELDPRWLDVLCESLGHRPCLLVVRDDGVPSDVRGYLPLALVRSRLFGQFLVSLPYLNGAGVVADDEQVAAATRRKGAHGAGPAGF